MGAESETGLQEIARFLPAAVPGFVGRDWVFQEVDRWLQEPAGARYFLLTGRPGCGKSAIAARLWDWSSGRASAPTGLSRIGPGFLSAAHCCTARDGASVHPREFARSLSLQLSARYPLFRQAVIDSSDRITATASAGTVTDHSTFIGFVIHNLSLNETDGTDAFQRVVRAPLEKLYRSGFTSPITILIDALDEALSYERRGGIVELMARLAGMPAQVRFILTSREDTRVLHSLPEADGLQLTQGESQRQRNQGDVRAYVTARLEREEALRGVVTAEQRDQVCATCVDAADGNFLYVRFLLDEIAQNKRALTDLGGLPRGLDLLYLESLNRMLEGGGSAWVARYAPVLGVLSVAQEPLSLQQISDFSRLGATDAAAAVSALSQIVEHVHEYALKGKAAAARFRLCHQSFIDFFRKPEIERRLGSAPNERYIPAGQWHQRIAEEYLNRGDAFRSAWDAYGLRSVARHLAQAAAESHEPDRHALTERLVRLVADPRFQDASLRALDDLAGLQQDLELAVQVASADAASAAPALLVSAAASFYEFRRTRLDPARPFELARSGQLEAAERGLALFELDVEWQQILLLLLAWIGHSRSPEPARTLLARVASSSSGPSPVIQRLAERIQTELSGRAPQLPSLPPVPPPQIAHQLVARMARALAIDQSITAQRNVSELAAALEGWSEGSGDFLSRFDSPLLVSYASRNPSEGEPLIEAYLAAHAGYTYVHYRNGSLLAMLPAVLAHPDAGWARGTLEKIGRLVLVTEPVRAMYALPTALLALQAKAGSSEAAAQLAVRLAPSSSAASADASADASIDTWGVKRRSLAALAEAAWAVCGKDKDKDAPGSGARTPRELVQAGLRDLFGLAGFQVTACLALSEASRMLCPDRVERCLKRAVSAAHNAREHVLCVRLTARVRALQLEEPSTASSPSLAERVSRLSLEASGPEFLPIHIIGERFEDRAEPALQAIDSYRGGLDSVETARQARTLRQLAEVFNRPLHDFLLANPGHGADEALARGAHVRVPDPGFRALLAARCAAEILADPRLPRDEQVELLQRLVPTALRSLSAVDRVLGRLLLAASPREPAVLSTIVADAARMTS